MPIYEYRCRGCKRDFEVLQKITDEPLAKCPECGKQVKRLISQTSFALKGGGWYKDGYSSTKANKAATESPASPKKKDKKAEKTPAKKNEK
ncbi:MAG TPA: zinc ribbon domain-containing protein [bacterium]|nr:zinc ribbon domain-containing protein [bacterium]